MTQAQSGAWGSFGRQLGLRYNREVKHTAISEPAGFHQLPKKEQILYVQALWDSIAEVETEVPVLSSQLDVAEARLQSYRQSPGQAQCARQMLFDVAETKL